MGTSLPELAVSMLAAVRGQPDIAVGNVLGSNIFNLTATLGLTALIAMLPVHGNAVRLEWPFMFVASCASLLVMRDGLIDRVEAGVFIVALALFTSYAVRLARLEVVGQERREFEEATEDRVATSPAATRGREAAVAAGLLLAGIACLVFGGRWLVEGATAVAYAVGMTERVVGLTVVAAGTGMPELATSVIAARRGQPDVAVANMIGSNIFNILGILGVTALLHPIAVSREMLAADVWWMLGTAALLYPVLRSGMRIRRAEGGLLLGAYLVYLGTLLL